MAHVTGDWEINLRSSKFGDEELEMLVAGVTFERGNFTQSEDNTTLQQLDVSIGDGGTTALAKMLKENRTLQQLDISSNSLGDGGATTLAEMLKENRTL